MPEETENIVLEMPVNTAEQAATRKDLAEDLHPWRVSACELRVRKCTCLIRCATSLDLSSCEQGETAGRVLTVSTCS
jgi:hypothetical protein